jgi:hypothetical protein
MIPWTDLAYYESGRLPLQILMLKRQLEYLRLGGGTVIATIALEFHARAKRTIHPTRRWTAIIS